MKLSKFPFSALLFILFTGHFGLCFEDFLHAQKSHCFSCASFHYLPLWQQLMHHYYPPKNFTDRCWSPDAGIGVVPCTSACFTLVERIDESSHTSKGGHHAVLRGCVDRLLLFGLDDDVRNVFSAHENQRVCRHTDRKLLRLYPLSTETDVVTFCTCIGDFCNEHNMMGMASNRFSPILSFLFIFSLLLYLF